MTPRAVLVGLPGTGKSTSGRRLAKILRVDFADSDDLVVAATGRTVSEIFAEDGEAAFRAAESAAIADVLAGSFDGILALGGGALMQERTREAVVASGVIVVVLQASLETLIARIGDARSRPLLHSDPPRLLAELATARQPAYDAVATITVPTDKRSPSQVAAHIAARLHTLGALA
jgi:shikimate kinase